MPNITKVNYRQIWTDHYGPIPKDENGITYDIHHIDGNRSNNDISNLIAVPLKEHYLIHYSKKEWNAAHLISQRLNLTPEERLDINNKLSLSKIGKPLSEYHKQMMRKPKSEKTKMKMKKPKSEDHKESIRLASIGKEYKDIECPYCKKYISSNNAKRWHFNNCPEYTKKPYPKLKCPHCLKEGNKNTMKQWHFDKCKLRK